MQVVASKEERSCIQHVDLHPHKAGRVAWEVMQCDTLAKFERLLVKCLPVPKHIGQWWTFFLDISFLSSYIPSLR